ncbi:MAG: DeoR family transcriptional regulator, partial [Sulfurovum sp.]
VPLKRLDRIIEIITQNRDITIIELANILEVADKTIKRDISKLKEQNRLTRVGSQKSGYWKVNHK